LQGDDSTIYRGVTEVKACSYDVGVRDKGMMEGSGRS